MTTVRPGPDGRVPELPLRLVAIAVGGSLGTLLRYALGRALVPPHLGFPWATLSVNISGSLLLGVVITLVVERWPPTRFVRPFAAIGFCGGFTTFSTMVVEADQLGRHGRPGLAALYLAVTLGAGLVAAALGIGLARWNLPVAVGQPIPDPDDLGPLHGEPDRPTGPESEQPPDRGDEPVRAAAEDDLS